MPVTEAIEKLMEVESEDMGKFPEGFGDTWAGRPRGGGSSKVQVTERMNDSSRATTVGAHEEDNHDGVQPENPDSGMGVFKHSEVLPQVEEGNQTPGVSFDYGLELSLDLHPELFGEESFSMPDALNYPSDLFTEVADEPPVVDLAALLANDTG